MLAGLLFPHMETSHADGASVRSEAQKEKQARKKKKEIESFIAFGSLRYL